MKNKRKRGGTNVPRNTSVLAMFLSRKGGSMRDRRAPRGGARNSHRDIMADTNVADAA